MKDLSLNFFTSSKGHFGQKDIYKYTLNDLYKKSSIIKSDICYKIAHIKISIGEEEIGVQIERDLLDNFKFNKVLKTVGQWSHADGSSHNEYLKDINKLYSDPIVNLITFGLWMEDDAIFETNQLDFYIEKAVQILQDNPHIIDFKYTTVDDIGYKEVVGGKEWKDNLYANTKHGISFHPHFMRNRDNYFISNFVLKHNIHPHCEMCYPIAAHHINSNKEDAFIFEDNMIVKHIGTKEFIEQLNKI